LPIEARIFVAALAFRVASALLAFLANVVFPDLNDQGFGVFPRQDHLFWDAFARYDSGWYRGIAEEGYHYKGVGRNNLAFFPAYPLLMRAGGALLGARQQDYYLAGIVISWLSFAAAMAVLYRLALLDLPRPAALRAVMYSAVFPAAFFFGMVYSESLYLLAVVTTAYAFRVGKFALAAGSGAVLTATRVTAVMALPGLALLAYRTAGTDTRRRAIAMASLVACLGGIAAFSAFNWTLSGHPFTWYDSITHWGYTPGARFPFATLLSLAQVLLSRPYDFLTNERMAVYDTVNAGAAVLAIALVPVIWQRFNAGYALIVLAALLLPLSSGQFEGLARYTSVQFPVALALASFWRDSGNDAGHNALLAAFAALYSLCLAMFVNVHPLF
jgi:predicted small integral membrane protein